MIRTFIAIDLAPEIKMRLDRLIRQMRQQGNFPVRWTQAGSIHITLKFLGDVEEKKLPLLQARLAQAMRPFQPFTIRVGGLGAFPNPQRARVLWVGCEPGTEGFAVQKAVETAMADMDFEKEDRPFNPHLTIGRVKEQAGPADFPVLAELLRETNAGSLGEQAVTGIRVYRSDLLPGGPKYSLLYDIPFESHP